MSAFAGFYTPVEPAHAAPWRRGVSVVAVVGVHVLILLLIAYAAIRPELPPPLRALAVRLVEPPRAETPKLELPQPTPPRPAPKKAVTPPPILTAARDTPSSAAFAVAPQPEPVAAPAVVAPAAPTISAPRFDADYLQNPKPVYPPMSRRMNEEGKVVLRVRVSVQGLPLAIEIKQSSGFSRLDAAAKSAVERWRFVPARQGSEAVEASVLVPLNFTLSN